MPYSIENYRSTCCNAQIEQTGLGSIHAMSYVLCKKCKKQCEAKDSMTNQPEQNEEKCCGRCSNISYGKHYWIQCMFCTCHSTLDELNKLDNQ